MSHLDKSVAELRELSQKLASLLADEYGVGTVFWMEAVGRTVGNMAAIVGFKADPSTPLPRR